MIIMRNQLVTDADLYIETIKPSLDKSDLQANGYAILNVTLDFNYKEVNDGYRDLWVLPTNSSSSLQYLVFDEPGSPNTSKVLHKTLEFAISLDDVTDDCSFRLKWGAHGNYDDDWKLQYTTMSITAADGKTDVAFDLNADEGSDKIENVTYTFKESYTLPTLERSGYTFKGWSDGKNTLSGDVTWNSGASALTLTAVWEKNSEMADFTYAANAVVAGSETAKTCVITGYTGTGDCVLIPEYVTSINESVFNSCSVLTRVYYGGTADKWTTFTSSIGSDNGYLTGATRYYYSAEEPTLNEEGTAYEGNFWRYVDGVPTVWNYTTVTFNLNGDEGSDTIENCGYTCGVSYTLPTLERSGYTFKGWSDGTNTLSGVVTWNSEASVLTLIAVWETNSEMADFTYAANAVVAGSETAKTCVITGYNGEDTSVYVPEYVTSIGETVFSDSGITVYYYSAEEPALNEEETAYDGNFWHYVDGVVTVWEKETVE